MEGDSIADAQITGSSYSPEREPHKARLNHQGAWMPNGALA